MGGWGKVVVEGMGGRVVGLCWVEGGGVACRDQRSMVVEGMGGRVVGLCWVVGWGVVCRDQRSLRVQCCEVWKGVREGRMEVVRMGWFWE